MLLVSLGGKKKKHLIFNKWQLKKPWYEKENRKGFQCGIFKVEISEQIFIIQNTFTIVFFVFLQFDFQWSSWSSQLLLINNVEEKLSLAKFYTSLHVCNHLYTHTHTGSAIANLTHHSISLIPPHAHTTYNLLSCYAGQCVGLWTQHPKRNETSGLLLFLVDDTSAGRDLPPSWF
jgi:hypothetical protein